MQPPSGNRITQAQHGTSKAIDYAASPDIYVYAPEDGRVESYMNRGVGTNAAGNVLRITGNTGMHSLCHLEESYVQVGSQVTKGQRVAKMGYTGYTIPSGPAGRHLHYYVLTPSGYVYPPNLYKTAFTQGAEVANREQVNNLYKAILHREGDEGGLNNYTGRDANQIVSEMLGSQEFKNHQSYLITVTKQVQDLQTALANEKNRPPQVVEKQVEKIVEKIVKVEVPMPVDEKQVVTNWLARLWNNLFKK